MKTLFFVLLACLLTACFRAPHLTSFPTHAPVSSASGVAAPLPPDREVYASSDPVAAAGTAPREAGEGLTPPNRLAYAPAGVEPSPAVKARPATRPAHLRRELRKAVRAALLHKRPAAGRQDNPAPEESPLPTVALVAGIIGIIGLVGSFASSVIGLGAVGGVFFLLAFLGGLTAVIAGGIAKGRIKRGQDAESGRAKATAGLIMGIVDLAAIFLLLILLIVIVIAWSASIR